MKTLEPSPWAHPPGVARAWVYRSHLRTLTPPVTIADLSRRTQVAESTVSLVLQGRRCAGAKTHRVQRLVARLLAKRYGVPYTPADLFEVGPAVRGGASHRRKWGPANDRPEHPRV